MNPRLGLQLTLSCVEDEYGTLGRELRGTLDALKYELSLPTMKKCMEDAAKHAHRIAILLDIEAGRVASHLNRHAVAAE
jgi:hypothetical protein